MVERDFSFIHSYSTRNTPTRSFIHTNTFTAEASCTLQTHAGGELRNSQQKRMRRDPYMNSGFTTHQHANNHTKQKTFTPRTHHTRFILMLATCDVYRAHRHGSESPYPGSTPVQPPRLAGVWTVADTETQHIHAATSPVAT